MTSTNPFTGAIGGASNDLPTRVPNSSPRKPISQSMKNATFAHASDVPLDVKERTESIIRASRTLAVDHSGSFRIPLGKKAQFVIVPDDPYVRSCTKPTTFEDTYHINRIRHDLYRRVVATSTDGRRPKVAGPAQMGSTPIPASLVVVWGETQTLPAIPAHWLHWKDMADDRRTCLEGVAGAVGMPFAELDSVWQSIKAGKGGHANQAAGSGTENASLLAVASSSGPKGVDAVGSAGSSAVLGGHGVAQKVAYTSDSVMRDQEGGIPIDTPAPMADMLPLYRGKASQPSVPSKRARREPASTTRTEFYSAMRIFGGKTQYRTLSQVICDTRLALYLAPEVSSRWRRRLKSSGVALKTDPNRATGIVIDSTRSERAPHPPEYYVQLVKDRHDRGWVVEADWIRNSLALNAFLPVESFLYGTGQGEDGESGAGQGGEGVGESGEGQTEEESKDSYDSEDSEAE